MRAMNPFPHRRPRKTFQALAVFAFAWAGPAYCASPPSPWPWPDMGADPGLDVLLLLLAALFWAVTHLWALLIVWAEARVTRSFGSDAGTKKEKP
jgi:hypothetical protein